MSVITDSVEAINERYGKSIQLFGAAETVTDLLVELMHYCDHTRGASWARCSEAARRQHAREIAEDALTRPMPSR